ncbi:hypothetical protein WA158_007963 [Blastocystis sp. Blastoise]
MSSFYIDIEDFETKLMEMTSPFNPSVLSSQKSNRTANVQLFQIPDLWTPKNTSSIQLGVRNNLNKSLINTSNRPYSDLLAKLFPYVNTLDIWNHLNESDFEDSIPIRDYQEELNNFKLSKEQKGRLMHHVFMSKLLSPIPKYVQNYTLLRKEYLNDYEKRQRLVHAQKRDNIKMSKSIQLDIQKQLPTFFVENNILYGQISVFHLTKSPVDRFEEYYHPYNPIQYFHNRTVIKYHYQIPTALPPSLNMFYPTYRPTVYFFPVGTRFSFYTFPFYDQLKDLFDPYFIVFFAKSGIHNKAKRDMVRYSYKNASYNRKHPFKIYFLIGRNNDLSVEKAILEEQRVNKDIIGMNILDTYGNNTLKVMMIEDLYIYSNTTTKFVAITDDDSCFNLKVLFRYLDRVITDDLYVGHFYDCSPDVIQIGKHSTPYYSIPYSFPFVDGPMMVLSNSTINKHVHVFPYLDCLVHTDDVLLSYLSLLSNVYVAKRSMDVGYANTFRNWLNDITQTDYLYIHQMEPKDFKQWCRQ